MPTALPITYCTEQDIQALLGIDGEQARLDDDGDGALSAFEQGYLTRAIQYATARINAYCNQYDPLELQNSEYVTYFASVLAARWLCLRRGNPGPASLESLYEEVMGELKEVRSGELSLNEISAREPQFMAWSNVRVDVNYRLKKIRVERPISERTPTTYPQRIDWQAEYMPEI